MTISKRYVEAVTPHRGSHTHKFSFCSSFFMLVFGFFLENAYSLASFCILLIFLQKQLT